MFRLGRYRTQNMQKEMLMLRHLVSMARLFFVALLFTSPALYAQLSTRATITGTVTDSTRRGGAGRDGDVYRRCDQGRRSRRESNGDGSYISPGLTVSTYSVTIAKAGFKTYTVTGIELHPTETVQVNGTLAVGAASDTVTVEATSTDVELSTPENSAYISGDAGELRCR